MGAMGCGGGLGRWVGAMRCGSGGLVAVGRCNVSRAGARRAPVAGAGIFRHRRHCVRTSSCVLEAEAAVQSRLGLVVARVGALGLVVRQPLNILFDVRRAQRLRTYDVLRIAFAPQGGKRNTRVIPEPRARKLHRAAQLLHRREHDVRVASPSSAGVSQRPRVAAKRREHDFPLVSEPSAGISQRRLVDAKRGEHDVGVVSKPKAGVRQTTAASTTEAMDKASNWTRALK